MKQREEIGQARLLVQISFGVCLCLGLVAAIVVYLNTVEVGSVIHTSNPMDTATMVDTVRNQTDPVFAQEICLYLAEERDTYRTQQATLNTQLERASHVAVLAIAIFALIFTGLNVSLLRIIRRLGSRSDAPGT